MVATARSRGSALPADLSGEVLRQDLRTDGLSSLKEKSHCCTPLDVAFCRAAAADFLLLPHHPQSSLVQNSCSPTFLNPSLWQDSVWNVFWKPPGSNHKGLWDGQRFPVYQASSQLASYCLRAHAREGKSVRGWLCSSRYFISVHIKSPSAVAFYCWCAFDCWLYSVN